MVPGDGRGVVKVRVHPGLCQGHRLCHRFAPEVYPLDEEGYIDLHLVDVPPELEGAAELGARVCPAGVITIIRESDGREGPDATNPSGASELSLHP